MANRWRRLPPFLALRGSPVTSWRWRAAAAGLLALLVLAPLLATAGPGHAQEDDDRPLVVFIQGRRVLNSSTMTNVGPEGVNQLAHIFDDLGADVEYRNIDSELPEETAVVVIARPLRPIDPPHTAYLWAHLQAGRHVLLALDPEGFFYASPTLRATNASPRVGRSGLPELFDADFGILPYETFVAESTFSSDSIGTVSTVYSLAFADTAQNPITEPLQQFGIPVWVWGARHMRVEPFVIGGQALPMIYTETGYAEAEEDIFPSDDEPAEMPLEPNLEQDFFGHLNLGAVAIDTETGARLAVLGDSEMIQNGYGLEDNGNDPRYPGNEILAERLAAWLLGIPEDQWPALPAGFTWIAIDGDGADWPASDVITAQDGADSASPAYDLRGVQTFADDHYIYLQLATSGTPQNDLRIEIAADTPIIATANGVTIANGDTPESVTDAAIAIGDRIELRLPRRLFSEPYQFGICLGREGAADDALDCVDQPITAADSGQTAPFDWSLTGHPLVTVYTNGGIYMRSGPGTDYEPVATIANATTLAALGRNADASWIRVDNANYSGWIASFLLTPNHDLTLLPELTPPQ